MILLSLAALATAAGDAPNCADPQTQADMNICTAQDFRVADAELNRQWAETAAIMRRVDKAADTSSLDKRPGYFAALLEAQRAWLKFRDAQCRAQGYAMRGGSGEGMVAGLCLASLTRARSQQLQDMSSDYNR